MRSAEYYLFLKKAEEYREKARKEPDLQVRRALDAVVREYVRRADREETLKEDQRSSRGEAHF
jgi:hypothetical protein